MLRTPLLEDLNRLACVEAQDAYREDQARARDALDTPRWIDTTQLDRYQRDGAGERAAESYLRAASRVPSGGSHCSASWTRRRSRSCEGQTGHPLYDGLVELETMVCGPPMTAPVRVGACMKGRCS